MPTSTQKRFMFRHRWLLVALYVCLLAGSHVLRRPRTFHPVDAPTTSAAGDLVLIDPLAPSAPALEALVAEDIRSGIAVAMPVLENLNVPSKADSSFASLAEGMAPSHRPRRVIANGQAGAVALLLAANRPDQVADLVLIDASGVSEFALLGERHLNAALYAIGGIALGAADVLIPRFGRLPDLPLRRAQLRLLRHSDRDSLRPAIGRIHQPVLLLETRGGPQAHSRNLEHERLLPQSELDVIPPSELSDRLRQLSHSSAPHAGPTRAEADPVRQRNASRDYDGGSRPRLEGRALLLTLAAIALATLVSEDLTCALTGLMIANGNLSVLQGVSACLAGIFLGDFLLFYAGRTWGRPALRRVPLRWMIDPLVLRETEEWFSRHAEKAILISRCLPGTRLPAYVAAGILGVPVRIFILWFVIAGLIWTPLFVGASALLAENALSWIDRYHHAAPGLVVCGLLIYLLVTHVCLPALNWRGRRKLIGRWRRWTRPEYWPTFWLYAPVVVWLWIRGWGKGGRHLDFTACNPCMPLSGMVEESKSDILDRIGDRSRVAPYVMLKADQGDLERSAVVDAFLNTHPPAYPVVLKPDQGQRGVDVVVARNRGHLHHALSGAPRDWMLQQYVAGEEYGVFVILPPGEEGFVFGITGKRFPEVVGDGVRPLEDLILADDRAVCQSPMLLKAHADRLYEVPEPGERIPLTDVGNHARGTEFVECSDLLTPALSRAVLEIAHSLPGFHFGRMDLRAPGREDFQAGRDLQVLEINGVTSEATNLYDRRYRYRDMVRILLKQWQWASLIGKTNRQNGHAIATWRQVIHAYDQYRKRRSRLAEPPRRPLQD